METNQLKEAKAKWIPAQIHSSSSGEPPPSSSNTINSMPLISPNYFEYFSFPLIWSCLSKMMYLRNNTLLAAGIVYRCIVALLLSLLPAAAVLSLPAASSHCTIAATGGT
eukprot:Em0647g1a